MRSSTSTLLTSWIFSSHPLALLGKQVLCLLPVDISNIGRDLQFCRCIFHDSVNMLVDVVKLTTDGIYGITQFKLGSLILLDRFILKCGIHNTVFRITIKVTVTIFACYFIWSVSHTSIDGWGIRLPDARIIWHMGKPNARRFRMQLTRCC